MKYLLYLLIGAFLFACEAPSNKVIFDIPILIGKDIDSIRAILGSPIDSEGKPVNAAGTTWINVYNKEGITLTIYYNDPSKRVSKFQIISENKSYPDKGDLMRLGNLDSTSNRYSMEADDSWSFSGYRIISVTPKHNNTF